MPDAEAAAEPRAVGPGDTARGAADPGAADPGALDRTFRDSSGRAVAILARLFGDIDLAEEAYHLYHATRADLLRRLNRRAEAKAAYDAAIALTANRAERDFLTARRASLSEQA